MVTRQHIERPNVVDGTHTIRVALKIHLERRVDFYRHDRLAFRALGCLIGFRSRWVCWCVGHYLPCCERLNRSSSDSPAAPAVIGFFSAYSSMSAVVASSLPIK